MLVFFKTSQLSKTKIKLLYGHLDLSWNFYNNSFIK